MAAGPQVELQTWSDERLVAACRKGDQQAWEALIDKYKNLIYSIPVKLGLHEEAADIFQSTVLELLSQLPQLREPRALPKWIIQTAYHKCLASRRLTGRQGDMPGAEAALPTTAAVGDERLRDAEREQALREALQSLPGRCERLVRMLFFEDPPRPYAAVAEELGIATGSIGFIRGRCLRRLRKMLEQTGLA